MRSAFERQPHGNLYSKSHFILLPLFLLLATTIFAQQPEKTAEDHVQAGLAAQLARTHEEALQHYAAAIKLDPKNFGAQFNSGVSFMILKRPKEALSAFKIADSLKANNPVVQFEGRKAFPKVL